MAARKNKLHPDPEWVERQRNSIKSVMLIKALSEHVEGARELKNSQVRAAEILLRKTMPDLAATDEKKEVTHHYVAEVPAPVQDVKEWQRHYADPLKPPTVQ